MSKQSYAGTYIHTTLLPFLAERIDAAEFDIQEAEFDQRPEDRQEAVLRLQFAKEMRTKILADYHQWRGK